MLHVVNKSNFHLYIGDGENNSEKDIGCFFCITNSQFKLEMIAEYDDVAAIRQHLGDWLNHIDSKGGVKYLEKARKDYEDSQKKDVQAESSG